jgi:DNA-binding MarR family transcriptional regulator
MPRTTGPSRPRKPRAVRGEASEAPQALAPGVPSTVRVLRRFRQVFNAVKTHFRDVEKKAGLGGAQIWALSIIASRPGMGVGALARDMDIHQTTASNLVKALLKQGLVQAHREGADRRTVQLRVTPAGRDALKRAPGPFAGVLPDALACLDDATLERLDHDLGVLIGLLQADEEGAGIPLANL